MGIEATNAQPAYHLLIETFVLLDNADYEVLQMYGLTPTQYAALKLLDIDKGQRLIDLTGPLLVDKSTVTRLIDRLEQEQLIRRIPDPDDRRAQRVLLTPLGLERRERAQIAHERSVEDCMAGLSILEQHQLIELLAKLRNCLQAEVTLEV